MKTLRRLLKLRKQNDRVKIQWLLCIGAFFFLGSSIYQGSQFYQLIHTPKEYELDLPTGRTGTVLDVTSLEEIEDVKAVTEEIESTVTVHLHAKEASIKSISVSKSYLEAAYGLELDTGMTVLYVNQAAYQEIQNMMGETAEALPDDSQERGTITETQGSQLSELQCSYEMNDKTGVARIVLLDKIQEEEACIYQAADSLSLQKERTGMRIYFGQQDIDGTHIRQVNAAGYSLRDERKVKCDEYEQQISWMKVRNQLILGMILFIFVIILQKYGK